MTTITAYDRLTRYEQWMVASNLKTIRETETTARDLITLLRANGFGRVADAVEELAA